MTKKPRTANQTEKKTTEPAADYFAVVGIGASAGGLQAFEEFFSAMPADSGLAFVLVSHLDPPQISILPELIQKKTGMKVFQAVDHMTIAPNQVYIIPPNRNLAIFRGSLQLFKVDKPRGTNMPIDSFLRSLAQDRGNAAIGIILSGTGTDGTLGIRAIKGEAGLVMVQDPETAGFDGMPRSAIATGAADYVLPPQQMPEKLREYVRHRLPAGERSLSDDDKLAGALRKIYLLLRTATDRDFSQYKRNTICRRIERRMSLQRIDDIDDYVRYLQESKVELNILFKELLIGVTSFFRDPAAFELLKEKYLPELLRDKPDDYQVRVWVPGCSSGEEAYTVAIVLRECMEAMGRHFPVQIFGTDLDEEAIGVARTGRYPESIAADLTPERLAKYFVRDEKRFTVAKTIREMVVFAIQDLIKDPPFTKLDLLCCRNVLIYFGPQLQDKLLPVFHYILKPDGLLFLGSSETIGHTSDLFAVLDKKWKIFRRLPATSPGHPPLQFPIAEAAEPAGPDKGLPQPAEPHREVQMAKLLKTVLAHSDMPPCVIVDGAANIVYVHGRTGRYLEPAEGEVSNNLLEMARPGLRPGLISAFRRMASERREITLKKLRIEEGGGYCELNLVVRPLPERETGRPGLMMVVFDELAYGRERADQPLPADQPEKNEEVKRLENDLRYTRENLQITIEELETSNEELKSANEELQSTNEELQSTNEELETSKEELQSLNEESVTVNAELQSRIEELVAANDDIKNLLDATDIATIFLDIDLKIRRFTPKSIELFHLTASDTGRPIEHFATTLKDARLVEKARTVLKDLGQHESETEDDKGRRYRMRVRPYRTSNNVIAGLVITFENISTYRDLVVALTESETLWRGFVENAPMGIFIVTDGRFAYLNPGARQLFGAGDGDEMLEMAVLDRVHRESHTHLSTWLDTLAHEKKPLTAIEVKWLRLDGEPVVLVISAAPISYREKDGALFFVREKL